MVQSVKHDHRTSWFFAAWVVGAVLTGGILTSFHQPFRLPDAQALSVVLAQNRKDSASPQWKVTHVLSGGCGCSRRVLEHLLQRRALPGVSEQILIVDGGESYLPGTGDVLSRLQQSGIELRHVSDEELQQKLGLRGVPILIVTTPENKVAYLGGYGTAGDRFEEIFSKVSLGTAVAPLPVVGCAVGRRNRRVADPFRLKY